MSLKHPGMNGLPAGGIEPKHPSIVQAICQVMSEIQSALKKSAYNKNGNYHYASADDVYGSIVQKMAAAGLTIDALEVEQPTMVWIQGKDRKIEHIKVTYQFVQSTAEATWTHDTCRRTVLVPLNGPQSFQVAQSYAEKAYYRSLFKIPTGDVEVDVSLFDDLDNVMGEEDTMNPSSAKRHGIWERAKSDIESAESIMDLASIDSKYRAKIPRQWKDPYQDLIAGRQAQLDAVGADL